METMKAADLLLRQGHGNQIFLRKAGANTQCTEGKQGIEVFRLGLNRGLELVGFQKLTANGSTDVIGNAQYKGDTVQGGIVLCL